MTHNGKIGRLPREIRDQLNRRLYDGEPGKKLVAWLNSLPETQQVLATGFVGRPISEQNVSAWKTSGYLQWLAEQETLAQARQMPQEVKELAAAADGQLTDNLSTVLAVRYAVALAEWNGEVTRQFRRKLRLLHGLCRHVTQLRRGDHAGTRLDLAQERLDWIQQKTREKTQQIRENQGNQANKAPKVF